MPGTRLVRRMAALTSAVVIACSLLLLGPPDARSAPAVSPGPHGAAKVYLWGPAHWDDEFLSRLHRQWETNFRHSVQTLNGMMGLKARRDGRMVSATLRGEPHRYGRWESRVRVRTWNDRPVPYRLIVELIPAGKQAYRCGAKNITLADYSKGDSRARGSIRTLPNREFTFSKRQSHAREVWNTYAVEITKNHIAWFVDDHVVRNEKRPAALSGVTYTVRYRFIAQAKAGRDAPWMQMDWSRYFTLKRPNARSIQAPQANAGRYRQAC